MTTLQITPHELAADDVLAVLLNEESAFEVAALELNLKPVHMPTNQHRTVLEAVIELRLAKQPVHDTTILDKCNGVVDLAWISQRFRLYDQTRRGQVFEQNIKLVIEHGTRLGLQRMLSIANTQLQNGEKQSRLVINQLIDLLSNINSDEVIKGETAAEHGADFRDFMNSEPIARLSTGLTWLDELTGGFDRGHIWWIAGAYKGRKSTFMLNLMLNALMNGGSVAVLSREMQRRRVNAQLVSMLSIAWLLQNNLYNANGENGSPLNWISPVGLMQAQNKYKTWDKTKVKAIDYGINAYAKFADKLRIYDTGRQSGSLADLDSAERIIKRDKMLYKPDIVFIDYLQLFSAPGKNIQEKIERIAQTFQTMAQREEITFVVVAQKNEDSIKNGANSYSPGIKGGGDPAQTADYLITTSYKNGDEGDENHINACMKLSRHGRGGDDEKVNLSVHPSSGLILEDHWIGQRKNIEMLGG